MLEFSMDDQSWEIKYFAWFWAFNDINEKTREILRKEKGKKE